MNIIYTVIVAVICFTLVIGIDFLLQEISTFIKLTKIGE